MLGSGTCSLLAGVSSLLAVDPPALMLLTPRRGLAELVVDPQRSVLGPCNGSSPWGLSFEFDVDLAAGYPWL